MQKRGTRVGGLLRYLYGPGKQEEHVNPRIVGAWDGAGDLSRLEPPIGPSGQRDYRRLVELLEQPIRAGRNPPRKVVWHTSLRNHHRDRILSDEQWGHIATEMMAGLALAPHGDTGAVRWLAIRHDDYGIHLVATLVRQDGRTVWPQFDKRTSRRIADELERRYGLRITSPADRTSHHQPQSAETSKARRLGRTLTVRDELRRRVRAVVAVSLSEEEFFARLTDDGVLVKLRLSQTNPDEYTGYSVALPGERDKAGVPVWFGASHLAADLSLPKLRIRWGTVAQIRHGGDTTGEAVRVSAAQRAQAFSQAAATVTAAADEIRRVAGRDPSAAQALAQAAADTLTAVSSTVEGRRGGPLTEAAERFDKAARAGYAKVARGTSRSYELRAMARLVRLMGHTSPATRTHSPCSPWSWTWPGWATPWTGGGARRRPGIKLKPLATPPLPCAHGTPPASRPLPARSPSSKSPPTRQHQSTPPPTSRPRPVAAGRRDDIEQREV